MPATTLALAEWTQDRAPWGRAEAPGPRPAADREPRSLFRGASRRKCCEGDRRGRKRRFLCLSKKISGASCSKPCCARADRAHVQAAGGPAGRAAVELGRRLGGRQAPHPTQRESRRGNKEGTRRTSQFPWFEVLANEAFFPLT